LAASSPITSRHLAGIPSPTFTTDQLGRQARFQQHPIAKRFRVDNAGTRQIDNANGDNLTVARLSWDNL
jgi:hypothetical protein